MFKIFLSSAPLVIFKNAMVDLPSPSNLSSFWNFGSLLGVCLVSQILTGLFLAMHYSSEVESAFSSVSHIARDVNQGWFIRVFHANGASMFFICLYFHLLRGLYYGSYRFKETWLSGVTILFLVMATAFLGYVLPWGQMSFWGATVITNLFSAIPKIGPDVVYWLWGGFAVSKPTLSRFFALHFILPFLVSGLVLIHLSLLHQTGSNNPLGVSSNLDKISFYPYFVMKDILGVLVMGSCITLLSLYDPWALGDPENFLPANPLVTPLHIQPEWYFLFAYAILRSIPNKLGGVLALVASIAILYTMPFFPSTKFSGMAPSPIAGILYWLLISNVVLLTWIGARPVEDPYILLGQILTCTYFAYYLFWWSLHKASLNFYL